MIYVYSNSYFHNFFPVTLMFIWHMRWQIMAIGTLALCYNNIEVFRGVVKMRRGKSKYFDTNFLVIWFWGILNIKSNLVYVRECVFEVLGIVNCCNLYFMLFHAESISIKLITLESVCYYGIHICICVKHNFCMGPARSHWASSIIFCDCILDVQISNLNKYFATITTPHLL